MSDCCDEQFLTLRQRDKPNRSHGKTSAVVLFINVVARWKSHVMTLRAHGIAIVPWQTGSAVLAGMALEALSLQYLHDLFRDLPLCPHDILAALFPESAAVVVQKIEIVVLKFQILHVHAAGSAYMSGRSGFF